MKEIISFHSTNGKPIPSAPHPLQILIYNTRKIGKEWTKRVIRFQRIFPEKFTYPKKKNHQSLMILKSFFHGLVRLFWFTKKPVGCIFRSERGEGLIYFENTRLYRWNERLSNCRIYLSSILVLSTIHTHKKHTIL